MRSRARHARPVRPLPGARAACAPRRRALGGSVARYVTLLALAMTAFDSAALDAQNAPRRLRAGDIDRLPSRPPDAVVWYGVDSLQHGALYLPAGAGPHPVVVLIHGGCWYSPYASRQNSAALADALAATGVAVWNAEYRRYDNPGGGWPGTFTDIAYAADFVRSLARSYPLDTTRVVAAGHSAGGHLALWLLTRRQLASTSDIATLTSPIALRGAVSLGGIADLAEYYPRERDVCGNPAVESLLGGTPAEVPERLRDGSPAARLPLGAPHWHVAGAQDPIAIESAFNAFVGAARDRGDRVTATRVPDAGHFEVIAPATPAGRAAIAAIREALGLPD